MTLLIKRSKTFSVGLPQTVRAFVCGLNGEEIIVLVLPFKDMLSNRVHALRHFKRGRMRFSD